MLFRDVVESLLIEPSEATYRQVQDAVLHAPGFNPLVAFEVVGHWARWPAAEGRSRALKRQPVKCLGRSYQLIRCGNRSEPNPIFTCVCAGGPIWPVL